MLSKKTFDKCFDMLSEIDPVLKEDRISLDGRKGSVKETWYKHFSKYENIEDDKFEYAIDEYINRPKTSIAGIYNCYEHFFGEVK